MPCHRTFCFFVSFVFSLCQRIWTASISMSCLSYPVRWRVIALHCLLCLVIVHYNVLQCSISAVSCFCDHRACIQEESRRTLGDTCVFFTLNRSFYPSTSSTPSVRADSSSWRDTSTYKLCGHKTTPRASTLYRQTALYSTMSCHDIYIRKLPGYAEREKKEGQRNTKM